QSCRERYGHICFIASVRLKKFCLVAPIKTGRREFTRLLRRCIRELSFTESGTRNPIMAVTMERRHFLKNAFVAGSAAALVGPTTALSAAPAHRRPGSTSISKLRPLANLRPNPIGVSTYSFWRFDGPKDNYPIADCIERAAEMGFDGVEILHIQMQSEENEYHQML